MLIHLYQGSLSKYLIFLWNSSPYNNRIVHNKLEHLFGSNCCVKGRKEELLNFLFFTICLIVFILAYVGQAKSHAVMPCTQLTETKKSWINYSELSTLMISFMPLFYQMKKQAKGIEKSVWYCVALSHIWYGKKIDEIQFSVY